MSNLCQTNRALRSRLASALADGGLRHPHGAYVLRRAQHPAGRPFLTHNPKVARLKTGPRYHRKSPESRRISSFRDLWWNPTPASLNQNNQA